MKKLTYWVAPCLDDSDAYSIRAKTRKEVVAILATYEDGCARFGKPKKVTVKYDNVFELLKDCLGEDRGCWEYGD